MKKPTVSLVIADTESYVLANNAIEACIARFDFSNVHVFTDEPKYWSQYQVCTVPTIQNIDDYNQIILEQLPHRVESDYCIVAQFDGFIINSDAFSSDFYKFDYIGAVWPDYPYFRVGNGGFSWRSRKLVKAVAELASIRQPGEAEDLFICRSIRVLLEQRYGCVFAPEDVARRFSYEIVPDAAPAFGFHGIFNLPNVYRDNLEFLVQNLSPRILSTRMPYLTYGARQIPEPQRQAFERLLAAVVEPYRTP